MRYQVVFQLPEDFFASADALTAFRDKLAACLPSTCEFDGSDVGAGTINFFVYTAFPQAAFARFRKYLGTRQVESKLRVAYREEDGERFTNLWPKRDPRPFDYSYR